MRTGQARKRDANEPEILAAWARIGVQAWPISGAGVPDVLTYRQGIWLPVEIKMPGMELTVAQAITYQRAPFPIVETIADAMSLFRVRM